MPQYRFEVGHATLQCELCDIDLADDDVARDYAVVLAAELFRTHTELYSNEWHLCSVRVWSPDSLIFVATLPRAAMIERDLARASQFEAVNH